MSTIPNITKFNARKERIIMLCIFTMLLLTSISYAESLEIKLIQYEPESTYARIQVRNIGQKSLKNLTLTIDDVNPIFLVGILSPGNAVVHSKNIPHGNHNLRVNANDGIVQTKMLLFAQTLEQRKKEIAIEKEKLKIKEETKEEQLILPLEDNEPKEDEEIKKKSGSGKFWIIFISLMLLAGIIFGIYWYLKRQKIASQRRVLPRPVPITRLNYRQRNPTELKRIYEKKAKKREQMLRSILRK